MRLNALAFLVGIIFCQMLRYLPDTRWAILLFPLVLLAWLLPKLRWLCFLALGFLWALWRASMILAQNLPNDLEGKDFQVKGVITNLPIPKSYGWQFDFIPQPSNEWPNPSRLRLHWYDDPLESLMPGQHWLLTIRLKPVRSLLNPGNFDYTGWLSQQHIRATGYVSQHNQPQLLKKPFLLNIDYLRYQLSQAIRKPLTHSPAAGILVGLAIGDRQWITPQQKTVLFQTGTTHLIAISGLHIGLVALFTFGIAQRLWRYLGNLALWLPAPRFAAILSLLAAFFYALLAGFPVHTQRALIMLTVAMLGIIITHRIAAPSRVLALSLLIVLLWDPLAVISFGFWLSFGVVTIIIYVLSNRRELTHSYLLRWGLDFWRVQIAAVLSVSLIFLTQFGHAPLSLLFANLIAVPWFSFAVIPLTLLGTTLILWLPALGSELLHIAAYLVEALWVSLEWLANPQWIWYQPLPPWWVIPGATIGILVLLLPRGFPAKWLGVIWLLPLFLFRTTYPNLGEIWFTLLEVGQGLAAVVQTQNYTLVYDTGAKWTAHSDIGQTVVIPFLRTQGIVKIDKLLISHGDIDHIGGATSILNNLAVEEILTSVPEQFKEKKTVRLCQAGQYWRWDQVDFKILHPPPNYFANRNNRSCVLKISTIGGSILLPGDIEKSAEHHLVNSFPNELLADILVAPHHGSKTSSTESFLQAVNPKIALFSVGYKNRARLPNPEIKRRYHRYKIQTWETAQTGAIQLRLTADGISSPRLEREVKRHYWHN